MISPMQNKHTAIRKQMKKMNASKKKGVSL